MTGWHVAAALYLLGFAAASWSLMTDDEFAAERGRFGATTLALVVAVTWPLGLAIGIALDIGNRSGDSK